MSNKFDSFSDVFTDDDNLSFRGISWFPSKQQLLSSGINYTITIKENERYRPDKIAYRLWHDENLWWILDILNDIQNISEYLPNKVLTYVDKTVLDRFGMI